MHSGKWKLVLPHSYRSLNGHQGNDDGTPIAYDGNNQAEPGLYDLHSDISETTNLAEKFPDVVAELMKEVDAMRTDLGDSLTGTKGSGARPVGQER